MTTRMCVVYYARSLQRYLAIWHALAVYIHQRPNYVARYSLAARESFDLRWDAQMTRPPFIQVYQ